MLDIDYNGCHMIYKNLMIIIFSLYLENIVLFFDLCKLNRNFPII